MPNPRKELLVNGEIYHVYNKSIGEFDIFVGKRELNRLFSLINYYKFPQNLRFSKFKMLPTELKKDYIAEFKKQSPLVEVYAYVFMPNHYHLLLKQIQDKGISVFVSNFQNGFAKYFNKKYERLGGLFLRPFKAKRIAKDEIFLHVSRYIHLNLVTSYLSEYEDIKYDRRSSFPIYLNNKENDFINTENVISLVGSSNKYEEFVRNQVDYQRNLSHIKGYILE